MNTEGENNRKQREENTMYNFNEEQILKDHRNGIKLVQEVEKHVDSICDAGYSSIIFMGIGGTVLYANQMMHIVRELKGTIPLYVDNAADYIYEDNVHLDTGL